MLGRLNVSLAADSAGQVPRRGRSVRWGVLACLLVALLAPLSLAPYLTSGTELVRLRNALSLAEVLPPDFDWQPPSSPGAGYLAETAGPAPLFAGLARDLHLNEQVDDWQRVLVISRHLLGSAPALNGGAIQSDLQSTYRRIVVQGDGYCGDFVRAFLAIAHAGGLTARAWAFSFDGFGGHGHIWVEVWNRQSQRWQLVDVFNNLYFTRADGGPLSALQLRAAMLAGEPALRLKQLLPGPRQASVSEAPVWSYMRRGIDQWYLVWGNNVQSYDQAVLVRAPGAVSRSLAQLGGIVQGVQPAIRILPTTNNQAQIDAMVRLRWHLGTVALLVPLALLAALVLARTSRRPGASG